MKLIIFLADIFFTTTIEIISAFILSVGIDTYLFKESHRSDENTSTTLLLIETCLFCGILGILTYLAGIVIRKIPFPLNGWMGYKHASYDELRVLSILSVFTLIFCDSIQYKLEILRHRFKIR